MNSSNLTPFQCEKTRQRVQQQVRFVQKMIDRMKSLRFDADDDLWRASINAAKALTELHCVLLSLARRRDRR